jgi:CPA1 family monovalent cation:H+ antiporter
MSRPWDERFRRFSPWQFPSVVVSTILIGTVLGWLTPLSIWPALLFGAIISATDPVSVVAALRQLGAPQHLVAIVEGESVLNDGTAVALAAVLVIAAQTGHFDIGTPLYMFLYSMAVAAFIGSAAGPALSWGTKLLDDDLVEMTLSTALAYGSYLVTEEIGASGIIAVVCAGLVFGSVGRRFGLSEESRGHLDSVWRYVAFLANAILFILIGLEIRISVLWHDIHWPLLAIVVVRAVRAFIVYGLTLLIHRVSFAYGRILVWGSLRGGVAIAVALSLLESVPGHTLILALTFGVVLFTSIIQGLTIEALMRRLGLVTGPTRGGQ